MIEKACDERLKPFIGNDSTHIEYNESFEGTDFFLSTDTLVAIMSEFSKEIQDAVDITTNKVKKESIENE